MKTGPLVVGFGRAKRTGQAVVFRVSEKTHMSSVKALAKYVVIEALVAGNTHQEKDKLKHVLGEMHRITNVDLHLGETRAIRLSAGTGARVPHKAQLPTLEIDI